MTEKSVKKPQDRKPKQGDGVTVDGVTVHVDTDALDDFELLDDLSQMQDGNGARVTSAFRRMFGEDSSRILDELREESGRVRLSRASNFMVSVMRELAPNS